MCYTGPQTRAVWSEPLARTHIFTCHLPKVEADALNAEIGRVYSNTLTFHYRAFRHSGHWLSPAADGRLEDALGG